MQKAITTILLFLMVGQIFAQKQRKISSYLFVQYDKTLFDITKGNNPSGAGLGFQAFFNNPTKFKPAIEATGDLFLENDKVLREYPSGKPIDDVGAMTNIFVGSLFQPAEKFYISFLAGPSFINGQTFLGIKPSLGYYFSKNKRWTGRISFLNIFNRDKITKDDFGSLVFSIGTKLFSGKIIEKE